MRKELTSTHFSKLSIIYLPQFYLYSSHKIPFIYLWLVHISILLKINYLLFYLNCF